MAGSSSDDKPAFLAVGRVRRPHGVKGELFIELYTDFPERLHPKAVVYLGEGYLPLTIQNVRPHKNGLLMTFDSAQGPEIINDWRNAILFVSADDRPLLPEGEYYHHQLIGMKVEDTQKGDLGVLARIIETGANDVYVVETPEGHEILLPAIREVVLKVDVLNNKIITLLTPGLLGEDL